VHPLGGARRPARALSGGGRGAAGEGTYIINMFLNTLLYVCVCGCMCVCIYVYVYVYIYMVVLLYI